MAAKPKPQNDKQITITMPVEHAITLHQAIHMVPVNGNIAEVALQVGQLSLVAGDLRKELERVQQTDAIEESE